LLTPFIESRVVDLLAALMPAAAAASAFFWPQRKCADFGCIESVGGDFSKPCNLRKVININLLAYNEAVLYSVQLCNINML